MDPFAQLLRPPDSSSNAPSVSFGREVATVNIAGSVEDVQVSANEDQLPSNTILVGAQPMAPSQLLCVESTNATDDRRGKKRNNKGKPQGPNDPDKTLTFCQVPLEAGDAVQCIVIQRGSGKTLTEAVVPLWPQVTARWSKRHLESQRWLRVRSDQQWFQMVCSTAKLGTRDCSRFCYFIQKQIVKDLVKKREAIYGSDSEDEDSQNITSAIIRNSIPIEICGCCVTCLNNGVQLAIQVDTDAQRFISEYLYNEALKFKKMPETSPTSSSTVNEQVAAPVQVWQPKKNWTPTIRDKVVWNVGHARFDVFLQEKKDKGSNGEPRIIHFHVTSQVDARAYQDLKNKQYEDAVTSWNKLDNSGRERIDVV